MCVAIPCRIESIDTAEGHSRPARVVSADGSTREIDLVLVPDATVGDYVIAHSGLAVSRIDHSVASATFELLTGAHDDEPGR
jgi:hydrogenase expression/formation protein HypC